MKTTLLSLLCAASAQATIIPVDVGPPRQLQGELIVDTPALAGTPVNGQAMILDYEFSHPVARNGNSPYPYSYITIRAETNMVPSERLYPEITGFGYGIGVGGTSSVVNFNGNQGNVTISGDHVTEVLLGLVYFDDRARLSGMHFEFTLPVEQGIEIAGLRFDFNPARGDTFWRVTESAPETGSTLGLLVLGCGVIGLMQLRRQR